MVIAFKRYLESMTGGNGGTMIVYPTTDYDSWLSEADANEYFDTRLKADAWDACTQTGAALMTAFRSLAELDLNIILEDDGTISATYYTDAEVTTILTALKNAQCEQALHEIIKDLDSPNISGLSLGGLMSVKIPASQTPPPRYSERALAILRPYVVGKSITRTR